MTFRHAPTPDCVTTYTERDAALYALTVGVAEDALDAEDLPLVYELCGDGFRVMPTFAVVFPFAGMAGLTDVNNTSQQHSLRPTSHQPQSTTTDPRLVLQPHDAAAW